MSGGESVDRLREAAGRDAECFYDCYERGRDCDHVHLDRFTRDTVVHTQTSRPHAYVGPPSLPREAVMRFLIEHGVWQELGTFRASQLATAITDLIEAERP